MPLNYGKLMALVIGIVRPQRAWAESTDGCPAAVHNQTYIRPFALWSLKYLI
jgi:hypothetical protein